MPKINSLLTGEPLGLQLPLFLQANAICKIKIKIRITIKSNSVFEIMMKRFVFVFKSNGKSRKKIGIYRSIQK